VCVPGSFLLSQASFGQFLEKLPEDDCRYAVYDFEYEGAEGVMASKIFFVAWSPDTARVKAKMLYASTKDTFRQALDGVQLELQATDMAEIDESVFRDKVGK